MAKQNYRTPLPTLANMQLVHWGEIAFRLQFVVLTIMYASFAAFLLSAMYVIFLLMISICTLGLIYLYYPGFASWWGATDKVTQFSEMCAASWVLTVPLVVIFSLSAIIGLSADRQRRHVGEIVWSGLSLALGLVFLVIMLSAIGGNS